MHDRTDVSPLLTRDRWARTLERPPAKPPSMRVFGLVMLIGFGFFGALLLLGWRSGGGSWRLILGSGLVALGALIALWSLVSPTTVGPVYAAWMRFGQALGTFVSTVLLALLYYLVLTPTGWLMRMSGTDPLERRIERTGPSYWRRHSPLGSPDSYEHMS